MQVQTKRTDEVPVVIIGAGPVGLTAAAHLIQREVEFVILEKGRSAGHYVRQWRQVRMFSPWKYNIDAVSADLLRSNGWEEPNPEAYPTGNELYEHLIAPLAGLPEINSRLSLGTDVIGISRIGHDRLKSAEREIQPFVVRVRRSDGALDDILAGAVIDASGTWGNPKPLGAHGLLALGEDAAREHVYYGIPDVMGAARDRYAGKRVAVVGAGDSAFNLLADLVHLKKDSPGTEILWVLRGALPAGAPDAVDQLPRRGALATGVQRLVELGHIVVCQNFPITGVRTERAGLRLVSGEDSSAIVDEVICVTGFKPDLQMLSELRLEFDQATEAPAALGPLIDPNVHSCGTVPPHGYVELQQPERGFFVVGMKSYGRAPTFLLMTGYEQVRSVVAALAGDLEAAREVSLTLPETGVCNSEPLPGAGASGGWRTAPLSADRPSG